MTAVQAGGPPISVQATGVILNPWYDLPGIGAAGWPTGPDSGRDITPTCRVNLRESGIDLVFRRDEMAFFFANDTPAPRYLVNPIRYFIAYRTFINYNLIGFASDRPAPGAIHEADCVRFRVDKIVQVESSDATGQWVHHEGRETWLEVATTTLMDFIRVLNPTLYYAMAFYLVGCENRRYFLVEFYKAVEAIENAFGSKNAFLKALKPFGVDKTAYSDFRRVSNDQRVAPLDIGRHAPKPGASLYGVDLRNLLVEPRSREVFESATVFCRQVVDSYIAFLVHNRAGSS